MDERELASNEVYPWNCPSVASKLPWFSHGELAHDSPPHGNRIDQHSALSRRLFFFLLH